MEQPQMEVVRVILHQQAPCLADNAGFVAQGRRVSVLRSSQLLEGDKRFRPLFHQGFAGAVALFDPHAVESTPGSRLHPPAGAAAHPPRPRS